MQGEINFLVILVCAVLAMVVGTLWYGPLFGKAWLRVIGASDQDLAKRKEMQKKAMPLYLVQFVLTIFQVLILAHLAKDTQIVTALERAFWIWAGFVMPTIAGTSMWNNDTRKIAWTRFLIQSGYQLVLFLIFGFVLMKFL